MTETELQVIKDFNASIKWLKSTYKAPAKIWVKAHDLKKFTKWASNEDYRKARNMGWVEYRIVDGKIDYNLNSIADNFLIKTKALSHASN